MDADHPEVSGINLYDLISLVIYHRPSGKRLFSEETFAHCLRIELQNNPTYSWVSRRTSLPGSCGGLGDHIDDAIDHLHGAQLRYSGDLQLTRMSELGKRTVEGHLAEGRYTPQQVEQVRALAERVWKEAELHRQVA